VSPGFLKEDVNKTPKIPFDKGRSIPGFWKGTATNVYPQLAYPIQVEVAMGQNGQFTANWCGEATMTDMYGRQVVYRIMEMSVGSIQGDRLVMQGQNKTIVANGVSQQASTDNMTVRLEGAELVWRCEPRHRRQMYVAGPSAAVSCGPRLPARPRLRYLGRSACAGMAIKHGGVQLAVRLTMLARVSI